MSRTDAPTPLDGTIRVALVDDQALFRAGIRMLVASQPDLEFVGEAGDGEEGVDVVARDAPRRRAHGHPDAGHGRHRRHRRDPGAGRRRRRAPPRIIVLDHLRPRRGGDPGDPRRRQRLRAEGHRPRVPARRDPHRARGHRRHRRVGDARAVRALRRPSPRTPAVPEAFGTLTTRERDIFQLAARGLSNSEIAQREFLSEATVKTHISRILAKLSLRDRVQLVVYAYEHGAHRPESRGGPGLVCASGL